MRQAAKVHLLLLGALTGILNTGPAAAGEDYNQAPLLPPGATVVLLSGLPGDLETETQYRNEMEAWRSLLQASGRVQRWVVLSDDPQRGPKTGEGVAMFLESSRSQFTNLSATLAQNTNPLVVIAWGHGGIQGLTPVLHVRGPRITPGDFKAVADSIPAPISRWVLIFKGSGAFARELACDRRSVLASEAETVFGNDPIGMNLLVKAAQTGAARPLRDLAREWRAATLAWYSERNLAPTEQPTLWGHDGQPDALAASPASAPNRPEPAQTKVEPPRDVDLAAATSQLHQASETWKDIVRADPAAHPQAAAVVLKRRVVYTLGKRPAITSEHEEFIQILTPEGKHFGDFDVSYSPPHEELNFLDCEVLRPDGELLRMDPDSIREALERSVGEYQVGRRKFFSLPGVVPGAILHVRYRTLWQNFPLPHTSLEIPIVNELPALESGLEVTVPKDAPFHFAFENTAATDPELSQTAYGACYKWRWQNLPAYKESLPLAPERQPKLALSTFPDWQTFGQWYSRIIQLTDEAAPEIDAKAKELTAQAKTDRDKVLALYNYVTALRYVAVPMGVSSFRPHSALDVLQNQFGDCKDKATLFNTLLRSIGLPARLVLVPRFGTAHDSVPGMSFNHAISQVIVDGQPLWIDTTDDVCRFGMLPPGDPGRKVLVIDNKTTGLIKLPAPQAKDHQLKIEGSMHCAQFNQPAQLRIKTVAFGFPDYQLRAGARETDHDTALLPLLGAVYRPASGSYSLERQTNTPISALDQDFVWTAEGMAVGMLSSTSGNGLVHAPFWLPKEWDAALHTRSAPLFLNSGYPLILDQNMIITLQEGASAVVVPALSENQVGPLRWKVVWETVSPGKLSARLTATLEKGELESPEVRAFQEQLRALLAAVAVPAVVSPPQAPR